MYVERERASRVEMRYLASILEGLSFPAMRWQIIAWAVHNGAGPQFVGAFHSMPEGIYQSISCVGRELAKADGE